MGDDPLAGLAVEVRQHFDATPSRVWDLLTDVPRLAAFSPEVVDVAWLDPAPLRVGSRFRAANRRGGMEWTVTGHVLVVDPPTEFAWCVGEPARPSSTWTYTLAEDHAGCLVTQSFRHGPGPSMLRPMIEAEGADVDRIVTGRADMLRTDMASVLAQAADTLR